MAVAAPLDVLYVGPDRGTSGHRARAIGRLGHRVRLVDPRVFVSGSRWLARWTWRTGALGLSEYLRRRVLAAVGPGHWDVALVDGGELIGPALVRDLARRADRVVNYNIDDPFGRRDRDRWRLYLRAAPDYDLLVVVRQVNVGEAYARGARQVLRVFRSADEDAHAPRPHAAHEAGRLEESVLFIGTWMPGRGAFAAELVRRGVPLAIYGDGWARAPEWPAVRACWRGPAIYGDGYVRALGAAGACLGLLSAGNRDLHTTRSMEIPFAGGLFCAERTSEHCELYREGEEAVFWADAEECAERCRELAAAGARRREIARSGRRRCVANGHLNERVMDRVLCEAMRG